MLLENRNLVTICLIVRSENILKLVAFNFIVTGNRLNNWKLCFSNSFKCRLSLDFIQFKPQWLLTKTHPSHPSHPMLHKFFTNHQYSASSSTVTVAHSGESQTKPRARSLGGDNSHQEVRKKISPQGYTSWMASAATQHPELGWSQTESDCVFLLMLVPAQTSLLVQPIWLSPTQNNSKIFQKELKLFKTMLIQCYKIQIRELYWPQQVTS